MKPRFIKSHPKTVKKLKRLGLESASTGNNRLYRRIQAILLNNEQKSSGEISQLLGVSRSTASQWLKTYSESGIEGLIGNPHPGAKSRLTDLQKILLYDIIDSGPVSYGLKTGVWTSPIIRDIIYEEFGVYYHEGHVRKLLKSFGFSVQRPKHLLALADAEKRMEWINERYPKIKKKSSK